MKPGFSIAQPASLDVSNWSFLLALSEMQPDYHRITSHQS